MALTTTMPRVQMKNTLNPSSKQLGLKALPGAVRVSYRSAHGTGGRRQQDSMQLRARFLNALVRKAGQRHSLLDKDRRTTISQSGNGQVSSSSLQRLRCSTTKLFGHLYLRQLLHSQPGPISRQEEKSHLREFVRSWQSSRGRAIVLPCSCSSARMK